MYIRDNILMLAKVCTDIVMVGDGFDLNAALVDENQNKKRQECY